MPGENGSDNDDTDHNGDTDHSDQSGASSGKGSGIEGSNGNSKDDDTNQENGGKDNSDQSSAGSVDGGGIAGGIVGGVLLVGVVLAGVAFVVHQRKRQKERAYDKHQEEGDASEQGRKAIAMIEMTQNPAGAAVGLVVDDPASTNPPPPPPTPTPPLPTRPAAISFGFNLNLASEPAVQAGRDRSSRHMVQKKKRSLPMLTSPVTPKDDDQGEQDVAVVATQFGAGKVLHYVRNGTCQVIELPWQLAGEAHAVLYRPVTA